jgi:sec-independent protein translocase protein TatB
MSFTEIVVVLIIAIIVVGPRQLPVLLRTAGRAVAHARRWLFDVRSQSGIDDILRAEGLDKDIREFRTLVRGNLVESLRLELDAEPTEGERPQPAQGALPAALVGDADEEKEYPAAGCDSYGAAPEDLDPYLPVEASRTGEGEP